MLPKFVHAQKKLMAIKGLLQMCTQFLHLVSNFDHDQGNQK